MKDRIQTIMEQYKMTQQTFAQKLELSPATISSIFTGRTNPTNNHVQAIHRAFPEINTNWLMFGEGDMFLSAPGVEGGNEESKIGQNVASPTADLSSSITISPSVAEQPSLFSETVSMTPQHVPASSSTKYPSLSPELQAVMLSQLASAKKNDKLERKIKEIRVFYDDGTFEAFIPSVK